MVLMPVDDKPVILVLPDIPRPDSGAGQRSLLLLEAAAALGPVHVVILSDQTPEKEDTGLHPAASAASWGAGSLRQEGLLRHVPLGALRLIAPARLYHPQTSFQARLDDLICEIGAKAVVFRYFPTFAATGIGKAAGGPVIAVDIDDRDDQKYATRLMRLFGERLAGSALLSLPLQGLARLMKARLAQASLIWFAGPEDAWTLPGVRTAILPNVPAISLPCDPLAPPSQGDSVLFVGVSGHVPNRDGIRWFLTNCWADLSRQCPSVRLRIVGRGIHWPEMAARYTHLERVDFVGPVEDLGAEYARARLCICPVREGGGSKIKVIEAAAFGRPIVGVPHAFRGFDHGIADHAAEARTPGDFVAACARFLSDDDLADRTGAALADWQRRHYSRDAILAQIRADIVSVMP